MPSIRNSLKTMDKCRFRGSAGGGERGEHRNQGKSCPPHDCLPSVTLGEAGFLPLSRPCCQSVSEKGVVRAARPPRSATRRPERGGPTLRNQRSYWRGAWLPFHPTGRRTAQAGGRCHPGRISPSVASLLSEIQPVHLPFDPGGTLNDQVTQLIDVTSVLGGGLRTEGIQGRLNLRL